jgi:hypothetical protein
MSPSDFHFRQCLALLSSATTLQLYPSPEWFSQVPVCSFGTRCPALPRKVRSLVSVIFPASGFGFTLFE